MTFAELHHQTAPLLIANVWDVTSAVAAQQAGFQALGTSSAAIAAMLGYDDGEALSFDELLYIVTRIKAVSNLPLSVDMEAGFGGQSEAIALRLKHLAQLGVAGVNLEDSSVVAGVRHLEEAGVFAHRLSQIRAELNGDNIPLFLNIRTDAYLLNHPCPLQETLSRGRLYQAAGADGLFVPCLTSEKEMAMIAGGIVLPLNVMCMPDLPHFDKLQSAGVHRISMGNFVHSALESTLKNLMQTIQSQQSFAGVFAHESS